MNNLTILPLGTNGFFSSFDRQTACYGIKRGSELIILDAGTGLYRLAEKKGQDLLSNVEKVTIFLSHYHLDHTMGFYAAFNLLKNFQVTVFGSEKRKVFSELTKIQYFPIDFEERFANFTWIKLSEGKHKIRDYSVKVRKQIHRGEGSLAYRFDFGKGDTLAYITDSEPSQDSVKFASNVKILLHEWEVDKKEVKVDKDLSSYYKDGHVTTIGAGLTARYAQVGKLVLIHHDPFTDNSGLKRQELVARTVFPKSFIALDLHQITID